MTLSEEELRKKLTYAMAEAVDDTESYDAYFGNPADNVDYGVARADGTMAGDMLFLWNFAGSLVDYVSAHGMDVLALAEQVGSLFAVYLALKAPAHDYDDAEKEKIKQAVVDLLRDLAREQP